MFRASLVSSLRPLTNPLVFQAARRPQGVAFRSFSSARPNVLAAVQKRAATPSAFLFKQSRTFLTDSASVVARPTQQQAWVRYGITAATVAGTIVGVNVFFNRETRDGLSPVEQSYLHESFMYAGGGLAVTALAARSLFKSGFAFRLMATNPWVVLGVSLVGSIGTMMGTMYTPPENTILKHTFWLGFNVCQAATLSPLFFLSPAILSRAALYTAGVFGSLSYIGATATNDKYLYMGGPLLAGVTVVALSSLAPMALPLGMRALAISEAISLYGGLAVFSGFVLFDTQKILQHARLAEAGALTRDPMREAISLELDLINIFIRIVQILTMQNKKK
ncbi:Bax inhibitor family protein [Fomitopsis betulina]|nr:Bax inhibitor family protein [Fomitopsis betulina]